MPLIRGHHSFDDHYTQIPNHWLRDSRLSLKAIGLLAQIMSHSPGWKMSIRSLAQFNNCGQETVKTAILELEKFGYLTRSEEQGHNSDGTFADYSFTTQDPFQNPVTVKPRHGETGHKEKQVNKNNTKEEYLSKKAKRPEAAAIALPDGWQPKQETKDKFGSKWQKIDYAETLEEFTNHHKGKGTKWKDWDLAFVNWCNRAEKWSAPSKPMTREEAEIAELLKKAKR